MRRIAWLPAVVALFALTSVTEAASPVPALVPVDDPLVLAPMLPAGISQNPPDMFGQYAHVWEETDGTQVIQVYGEFSLRLGQRCLRSQEAVVWMQKSVWQKTNFFHFEVYLSKNAEVKENAGTATSGPVLFVTFNSILPPAVEADIHTGKSGTNTVLFEEASKTRKKINSGGFSSSSPSDLAAVNPAGFKALPKARGVVQHTAKEQNYNEQEGIVTASGNVYVAQGGAGSADFLEIRADAAVLFLAERSGGAGSPVRSPTSRAEQSPFPTEASPKKQNVNKPALGGDLDTQVVGAYLRGNVILNRGDRMVRASELYYDFENERALMLDAVMRTVFPGRDLPVYVRAQEVRQLSSTEYTANRANISASEFNTPHVSLGAERVYLTDTTPRDETGRIVGIESGNYQAYDTTLNLDGVPVAYWPYQEGDIQRAQTMFRSIRFAYSDDFGATFQSKWYLFNLLGLEEPAGVEAILRTDYFSERGPGVGMDVNYQRPNRYGEFRGYYIHDEGEDNLGPFRNGPPDTDDRGRITIRHRELLPDNWELTLEGSYLSDPNFLNEYFRKEFETGKAQETLIYLKKQEDNWAFTALAQWRVVDFLTQTEHLPDTGFNWSGQPLGEIASYFNDSHLGFVRYQPDNRQVFNEEYRSDVVTRADTRNEIDIPIKLGDVNLVPFAMARPGYWDDSPFDGSVGRMFGQVGARAGTQFWKTMPCAESKVFDVNGIRHIIRPQATAWGSSSNTDSRDLYPFDQYIEDINDSYGTSLALRNVLETKRGGPNQWRTVDWMKFDVELNLFGNAPPQPQFWSYYWKLPIGRYYDNRPENSIARNHVKTDYMWRISDSTAILSESNYDLDDGRMNLLDVSYAVERTPRFSYFVGYRRIAPSDSNLVGGGFNYQLNEKHTVAVRTYYDLERGELQQLDLALIRKFPRFNAGLTFGLDNIENDFNVGVSLWPEGAPRVALGSRRYAKLSESTELKSED